MSQLHMRLDAFLEAVLEERQRDGENTERTDDYLDVLLASHIEGERLNRNNIKAALLDVLEAGIDTSMTIVEWAMAELLRNPRKLAKLRHEIDSVAGPDRKLVEELELQQLKYLKAVMKEVYRLHPPAPLMAPHESSEPCEVGSYKLPSKTRLIVNLWAIGRDENIWKEPDTFWPERFLDMEEEIDVRGQHFELLPFGSGRRSCPGMPVTLLAGNLVLASLVHGFEWQLPAGVGHLDMKERSGSTTCMAHPLLAIPKLTLAHNSQPKT